MHETAPNSSSPQPGARSRVGLQRFSSVELLIAIVLLFVTTPFLQDLPGGDVAEAILMSLVLVFGVLAVGGRRRMLAWATLLVLPAVLGKWLNHVRPELCPRAVFYAGALIFIGFVVVNLLRFVLRSPRVNSEVLCASVAAYLLLGLAWAFAYALTVQVNPGAFAFNVPQLAGQTMDGPTAFYFSFVTLSTVGYGDITPVSPVARMLAVTEAMTGLLYVAVLIARLVALYSTPPPSTPPDSPDQTPP
jgi:voltage-gated potassium channel